MTDLSIILVNWNCLAFTEQCIASILATVKGIEYEVIVVDNASQDAPCSTLTERFPGIQLILSDENIGFGQANNLGARHSTGEILLFLNPDTLVIADAIVHLVDELRANARAGAVGCRLLNPDGSVQTSSVQSFPTISNQLFALRALQRRWPDLELWGKRALSLPAESESAMVDVVSGACLMVGRQVFEAVGGFSSEYFMFAEEVDLCHEIRRAGWRVLHVPGAKITHFGGQSTKSREDGFAEVAMRDSVYRYLGRTRGGPYGLLFRASILLSAMIRVVCLMVLFPPSAILGRPRAREGMLRAMRKWLRIGRWALGAWSEFEGRGAVTGPSNRLQKTEV